MRGVSNALGYNMGRASVQVVAEKFYFFQAEDGIRDKLVTGVQTCALPICEARPISRSSGDSVTLENVAPAKVGSSLRKPGLWRRRPRRAPSPPAARAARTRRRSEERRVGKECRSRGLPDR